MVLGTLVLSLGLISLADSIGLMAGRSAYGLPSYLKMLESEKREISGDVSTSKFNSIFDDVGFPS